LIIRHFFIFFAHFFSSFLQPSLSFYSYLRNIASSKENGKILIGTYIHLEVNLLFMLIVMLSLLGVSFLLFIFSFFAKDPYKSMQDTIDQLSLQTYQELHKVKKKLKLLEEELLLDEVDFSSHPSTASVKANTDSSIHAIIKNQVWSLASQGVPVEQIASQSSLSIDAVQRIIMETK